MLWLCVFLTNNSFTSKLDPGMLLSIWSLLQRWQRIYATGVKLMTSTEERLNYTFSVTDHSLHLMLSPRAHGKCMSCPLLGQNLASSLLCGNDGNSLLFGLVLISSGNSKFS